MPSTAQHSPLLRPRVALPVLLALLNVFNHPPAAFCHADFQRSAPDVAMQADAAGQETAPRQEIENEPDRQENPAGGAWASPDLRDRERAAAEISGTSKPGIIDHLLQRPLPDADAAPLTPVSISISYPSLGRSDIDADIRQWATGIADAFEQYFDSKVLVLPTPTEEDGNGAHFIELSASYSISRPSAQAVSITFEIWNYTGGTQGNMDLVTLNYSLITGRRLSLADIFELPDEAIKLMSEWSRKILARRLGDRYRSIFMHGTEPIVENFSSLTLTPKGIRINFQPYQVASGELGAQEVDMPLEALDPARPLLALWQR